MARLHGNTAYASRDTSRLTAMARSIEALAREDRRDHISLLDPAREYHVHRAELLAACERVLGRMQLRGSAERHAFETEMAAYLGTRRVCGVASGTEALWLAVRSELATIIERRLKLRRLDCPYIFHIAGKRIGDFRKLWRKACTAAGVTGRIIHDLRRSGVRHLIRAGVPPHTVMAFSGHRPPSMLKRYDIISLDDLRAAAERGSDHATDEPPRVVPIRPAKGENP